MESGPGRFLQTGKIYEERISHKERRMNDDTRCIKTNS